MNNIYDVIIIGLGPAGLMAAATITRGSVLVLEKNESPGKKLLITGGGRCNVTNLKSNNDFVNNLSQNKKHFYSAINNFGPKDVYDYFINNGVQLIEEEHNKIFTKSGKASDILNALLKNIKHEIKYNEEVLAIQNDTIKIIKTKNTEYKCKKLIIATGGVSYPITGSTGDHLKFAKTLNQAVTELYPAESAIILKDNLNLAGTAINNVTVTHNKFQTEGSLMFTHKGISGESIMKISEYIYNSENKEIHIDFLPNIDYNELNNRFTVNREKLIIDYFKKYYSKKFIGFLLNEDINLKFKNLTKTQTEDLINKLKNYKFQVSSLESIEKAYVTGGGIDMKYINSSSMESLTNKNIYFIGETLDIHGPIGGYNITLALSTGYLAATHINRK